MNLELDFWNQSIKNALVIALKDKGLLVETEKRFEITFRDQKIGVYIADLIVCNTIVLELKCCDILLGEHQAQTINYLKASGMPIGFLVNFGKRKVNSRSYIILIIAQILPYTIMLINNHINFFSLE